MKALEMKIDKNKIKNICREHGIKRLALFGSILRDDFGPESDVDIVLEFHEEKIPGLFTFNRIRSELSAAFSGRQVDLTTYAALSKRVLETVEAEGRVEYDEAV